MSPVDFVRGGPSGAWTWIGEQIWRVERGFENARAQRREQDASYRIFFVLVLFATAFATLACGALHAVISGPHEGIGAASVPVARADLVDRNGQLLAVDLTHFGAYLDPHDVWDVDETRRALTAALPPQARDRVGRALASGRRTYLVGGLTPEEKDKLHDLGLPGLSFEEEDRRVYPAGSTAAHLIGFTDTGGRGLAGAERGLDKLILQEGADGRPVALSIDIRVQAVLDEELKTASDTFQTLDAAGIVVDLKTGEILAMSSYPTFDPNELSKTSQANLTNHVAQTVYEPGSVFKVFTLAMGIDSGVADINTPFDVRTPLVLPGRIIHDDEKGDATLPLWKVFTHSSNIGAAKLGLRAGADRMSHYFSDFGLFAAAPSELAESARPLHSKKLDENTVASMSFGQAISVSPLALATGMSAILDGGIYRPLTIRKVDGAPAAGRRVIQASTSRTMLDLMRLNAVQGTGRKADALAPGLRLGGKTGTAQKPENGHYGKMRVTSFASVFPTDGPMDAQRYFILVTLDSPHPTKETFGLTEGAWNAAPTVGRVIDRIAPFLGVKRVAASPGQAQAITSPQDLGGAD
ncbi:MAG TPA: penicillin-binding protein 2 [Caulobacteraceae bacterium]